MQTQSNPMQALIKNVIAMHTNHLELLSKHREELHEHYAEHAHRHLDHSIESLKKMNTHEHPVSQAMFQSAIDSAHHMKVAVNHHKSKISVHRANTRRVAMGMMAAVGLMTGAKAADFGSGAQDAGSSVGTNISAVTAKAAVQGQAELLKSISVALPTDLDQNDKSELSLKGKWEVENIISNATKLLGSSDSVKAESVLVKIVETYLGIASPRSEEAAKALYAHNKDLGRVALKTIIYDKFNREGALNRNNYGVAFLENALAILLGDTNPQVMIENYRVLKSIFVDVLNNGGAQRIGGALTILRSKSAWNTYGMLVNDAQYDAMNELKITADPLKYAEMEMAFKINNPVVVNVFIQAIKAGSGDEYELQEKISEAFLELYDSNKSELIAACKIVIDELGDSGLDIVTIATQYLVELDNR